MIKLKLIYNIIAKSSLKNLLFLMGGTAVPPLPPHATAAPLFPYDQIETYYNIIPKSSLKNLLFLIKLFIISLS